MKTIVTILSLLVATSALAIETKSCPKTVKVTVSGLALNMTPEKIIQEFGGQDLEPEEIAALNQSIRNFRSTPSVVREFNLTQAKNGKCIYRGKSEEKVEIYTQQGQNKMYFQTVLGPRGILLRAYVQVLTVEPKRIALATTSPGLAMALPRYPYTSYSAGGNLIFVGQGKVIRIASK